MDDDPLVRLTLKRILGRFGFCADEAPSAAAALIALRADARFDAVLCDINMPGMSGDELLEATWRELPALARRFVMVSSDSACLRNLAKRYGIACVEKPFDVEELAVALRTAMASPKPPAVEELSTCVSA